MAETCYEYCRAASVDGGGSSSDVVYDDCRRMLLAESREKRQ